MLKGEIMDEVKFNVNKWEAIKTAVDLLCNSDDITEIKFTGGHVRKDDGTYRNGDIITLSLDDPEEY